MSEPARVYLLNHKKHARYAHSFKVEALKLVEKVGTISASKLLSMPESTLEYWVKKKEREKESATKTVKPAPPKTTPKETKPQEEPPKKRNEMLDRFFNRPHVAEKTIADTIAENVRLKEELELANAALAYFVRKAK